MSDNLPEPDIGPPTVAHTSTLRDQIVAAIIGVDDWRGVTDPAILADAVIDVLADVVEDCRCQLRYLIECEETPEHGEGTCGCADCCNACWFDCCASRQDIETEVDMCQDLGMEMTNCGFVPQAHLDWLIREWETDGGR